MDPLVDAVMEAARRRDANALRSLLHPYLRWTAKDGVTVRGRNNVLALVARRPPTSPPQHIELRDGQIYRWIEMRTLDGASDRVRPTSRRQP